MDHPTDLTDCSALTLLALYRTGEASPVEATRAVLERIEQLNPVLNAFCHVAGDEALASARASESRWRERSSPVPHYSCLTSPFPTSMSFIRTR